MHRPSGSERSQRLSLWTRLSRVSIAVVLTACTQPLSEGPSLSRVEKSSPDVIEPGTHVPNAPEAKTAGRISSRIVRGSPRFSSLVRASDPLIVFKDEERTAADRMMTPRLYARLRRLAGLVSRQWPNVRLRVTEAWDEHGEHGPGSLHYEGRAADLTASDLDTGKLGRVARLAVRAGFDWVYFEDRSHIHASVRP